ncbi:GNAT family N-acetyltransferase [Sulfurimonas sp. HSL-1656]|uniref:GNAT family N-acetyltransferase n=1 Tax=Thiomicrolovo subterrani TaxID=3131934 RepID=UPI0031F84BB5
MELREATPLDFGAIAQLVPTLDELFRVYPKGTHPFTVDQVRFLAASREELTVAVEGGKVIGFANLYNIEQGHYAFIGNVVVAKEFRGQGVGRLLVSHMTRQAFDKYDVHEVRISVFNDNTAALLLYARMHFKPYAVEERINPSGMRVGLIHMGLERSEYKA